MSYTVLFENDEHASLSAKLLLSEYVNGIVLISKTNPSLILFTVDCEVSASTYVGNYQTLYGPDVLTDTDIQVIQKFNSISPQERHRSPPGS